jgi:uncharacterized membrane protein YdbT with pleckstrin-like domain
MGYIQDNLIPNEEILFSARVHPAVFLPSIVSFIMSMAVAIYALSFASQQDVEASMLAGIILLLAAGFFIYSIKLGFQALIIMLTTEFAVTNRRVIAKTGFIRRHTLEMFLPKVESVAVHQNILGRLLNFGTVTVTGTGGTKESFRAIVEPIAVRSKINEIIEGHMQAYAQQQ